MPPVYFSPSMLDNRGSGSSDAASSRPRGPAFVSDLAPSTCFSLYRTLDDQVILHFNRASAHSRDTGESAPPSLLQKHSTQFYSTSARDLGKSTYASVPNDVCAQFWQHLVKVWSEREDAIRYCISVTEKAHVPTTADNSDLRLDGDARAAPDVQSRSEHMDEFLMRQLRNELTIETIIRLRSLEAFKERCRVFAPSGNDARELEYWAGK